MMSHAVPARNWEVSWVNFASGCTVVHNTAASMNFQAVLLQESDILYSITSCLLCTVATTGHKVLTIN
jgi:hypothetical protein